MDEYNTEESDRTRIEKRAKLAKTLAKGGMDNVHVISFESARKILTNKKQEIITFLSKNTVNSIQELADNLNRDKSQVSRDLKSLCEHGIVTYEKNGKSKKPMLRNSHIVIEPII